MKVAEWYAVQVSDTTMLNSRALTTNPSQIKVTGNAVVLDELTQDEIQKAKDFIWQYLEPHNQQLVVAMATKSLLSDNNLSVKKVELGFQYNR